MTAPAPHADTERVVTWLRELVAAANDECQDGHRVRWGEARFCAPCDARVVLLRAGFNIGAPGLATASLLADALEKLGHEHRQYVRSYRDWEKHEADAEVCNVCNLLARAAELVPKEERDG